MIDHLENSPDLNGHRAMGRSIIYGVIWNGINLILSRGITLLTMLILARILIPDDFGLVAMAMVFTGFIRVTADLGLAAALIQRRGKQLSSVHFNTAFWASAGFNIIIFLVFAFVIAPFAAWFYEAESIRAIIAVSSFQMILSTLAIVPRSLLIRALRFRPIALAESLGSVVGAITGIFLALNGFGVWSLVFQALSQTLFSSLSLYLVVRWTPRIEFSKSALRDLLGFGLFDALNRAIIHLSQNLDYLLVGKWLGAQALGHYSLAFIMTDIIRSQLMSVLNKVMFPVYSRLQDSTERIQTYYLTVIRYNTIAITPIMLIFFFLASPLVHLILGEGWEATIFPLKALSIACVIHTIGGTSDSVIKGSGRSDLLFKLYVMKLLLISLPAFSIGTYFFGLPGAATAMIVHKLGGRIMHHYTLQRLFAIYERDILKAITPAFLAGVTTVPILISAGVYAAESFVHLATISFLIVAVFYSTAYFLVRDEIQNLRKMIISEPRT